jgi:hypothetical protein
MFRLPPDLLERTGDGSTQSATRREAQSPPRVIARWDERDASWQPEQTGPRKFDRNLGLLISAVRAPAVAAGLPEGDVDGKRGYVWHCSARVAACRSGSLGPRASRSGYVGRSWF